VSPRTLLAGTISSSPAAGPTRIDDQADRPSDRSKSSCHDIDSTPNGQDSPMAMDTVSGPPPIDAARLLAPVG
jgi:hypothetical protein